MHHLGEEVGLSLSPLDQEACPQLSQEEPCAGLFHGNPKLGVTILELFPLLNADMANIAVDQAFLSMEPVRGDVQLMHVERTTTLVGNGSPWNGRTSIALFRQRQP